MRRLFTNISHYYFLCGLFFIALIIWLPDSGYDKYFWVSWAKHIHVHGLAQAYNNPEINYHPIILFIIKGFTLFFNSSEDINNTNINWLKIPTALFDWGIIFIALNLLKQHKKNLQWGLLLVFNPAFWYNTIIWGQFDSIWVFFTLLAFYLMHKRSPYTAFMVFSLALNTKLLAIFFLLFFLLYCNRLKVDLTYIYYRNGRKNTLNGFYGILATLWVLQAFLIAPFVMHTTYNVTEIIQRSTEYYTSLSRNAYNIWYYLFNAPVNTADSGFLIPSIIFVGTIFCVLLFLQYKNKLTVWNAIALASLVFFLFLTRMHERYAHAALVFSAILFFLTPSPFRGRVGVGVLLISLAYFLNLEAVMQTANKSLGLNVDYTSILFNPKMVATLYFIACLILAYNTFKSAANSPSPLEEGARG